MGKRLRVLSLFDGMSGAQQTLDMLGKKVKRYYASEIDKYAIQVTQENYPNTIQLGSITELSDKDLKALGKIDLLIGGSPCQGFSLAGKMKGSSTKEGMDVTTLKQYLKLKKGVEFEGQSYLFWEYIRVLQVVKPKYFLLENVRVTKKWLPMFNEAVGVEPIMINSAVLTAQNRVRFYWTNIPNVKQPKDKGVVLKDILLDGEVEPLMTTAEGKSYCLTVSYPGAVAWNSIERKQRTMVKCGARVPKVLVGDVKYRKLTPIECERLQGVEDNYTACVSNTQRYRMLGNGFTIPVIAHILKKVKR